MFQLLEEGDAQEIVRGFLERYGESRPGGPSHILDPMIFNGTPSMRPTKTNEQLITELEALSAVTLGLRNDLADAYLKISKLENND